MGQNSKLKIKEEKSLPKINVFRLPSVLARCVICLILHRARDDDLEARCPPVVSRRMATFLSRQLLSHAWPPRGKTSLLCLKRLDNVIRQRGDTCVGTDN